jgi:hypothetical protein
VCGTGPVDGLSVVHGVHGKHLETLAAIHVRHESPPSLRIADHQGLDVSPARGICGLELAHPLQAGFPRQMTKEHCQECNGQAGKQCLFIVYSAVSSQHATVLYH